ncbi:MAG: hypothetical protein EOO78_13720 [Oxalobacteraceae bacterium]|nr:MAG: hypothetical protein EOO78_13720 [Oxalobacteraceae bacterium]
MRLSSPGPATKSIAAPSTLMSPGDFIRIGDISVDGAAIDLVAGPGDDSRKIYRCAIDQQTGDLAGCASAGEVPGLVNSAIARR